MRFISKAVPTLVFFLLSVSVFGQIEKLFAPLSYRYYEASALIPLRDTPFQEATSIDDSYFEIIADTVNGWKNWHIVENYTYGKDRGSMPMIVELNALHPYFRDKITQLIKDCKSQGITLSVVESYRTHAKQNEYKTMGKKYTRSGAGKSKHQYGLAVDLVPTIDSVAVWDNTNLWKKVGLTGEKLGLRWGGRWKKPYDPGHFEWTGGLTTSALSSGIFPYLPELDQHYPCIDSDLKLLRKYWREWEVTQSSTARK